MRPLLLTLPNAITQHLLTEHGQKIFVHLHCSIQKKKFLISPILVYIKMLLAVLALGAELKSKSQTQLLPLTILKGISCCSELLRCITVCAKGKWKSPAVADIHQRSTTDRRDPKNHNENCLAVHLLCIWWLITLTKICFP